jgi:multiple sugar transport system substrate-binding protein
MPHKYDRTGFFNRNICYDYPLSRLSRRDFLRGVLCVAGAFLTGCAPGDDVGGRTLINHWYHQYGESGTHEAVLRYAAGYTRQNPDIAIRITWTPGDYPTKVATALLTPEGPDVFETQLTTPMVDAGQVTALDDFFSPEIRADILPACMSINTVNNHIYGIHELIDTDLLYYRKSQLEAAGVAPPATFAELIDVANKLKLPSGRKGIFLGNDGGITALLNLLPWSAHSDFVVNNKIVFNNSRTAEAFVALRTLNNSDAILLDSPTDYYDPTAMIQGLAAMQWSGLWAYPALHRAFGDDLWAMPLPAFDQNGIPSTLTSGWSAMVNAQSRHVEEAKRYVKFLWIDSKAIQLDWCLGYGFHIPPRMSLARSAPVLKSGVPDVSVRSVRDYGRFLPPIWNTSMTTALTDAATNIVKLGADPSNALDAAAKLCAEEIDRTLE